MKSSLTPQAKSSFIQLNITNHKFCLRGFIFILTFHIVAKQLVTDLVSDYHIFCS